MHEGGASKIKKMVYFNSLPTSCAVADNVRKINSTTQQYLKNIHNSLPVTSAEDDVAYPSISSAVATHLCTIHTHQTQ